MNKASLTIVGLLLVSATIVGCMKIRIFNFDPVGFNVSLRSEGLSLDYVYVDREAATLPFHNLTARHPDLLRELWQRRFAVYNPVKIKKIRAEKLEVRNAKWHFLRGNGQRESIVFLDGQVELGGDLPALEKELILKAAFYSKDGEILDETELYLSEGRVLALLPGQLYPFRYEKDFSDQFPARCVITIGTRLRITEQMNLHLRLVGPAEAQAPDPWATDRQNTLLVSTGGQLYLMGLEPQPAGTDDEDSEAVPGEGSAMESSSPDDGKDAPESAAPEGPMAWSLKMRDLRANEYVVGISSEEPAIGAPILVADRRSGWRILITSETDKGNASVELQNKKPGDITAFRKKKLPIKSPPEGIGASSNGKGITMLAWTDSKKGSSVLMARARTAARRKVYDHEVSKSEQSYFYPFCQIRDERADIFVAMGKNKESIDKLVHYHSPNVLKRDPWQETIIAEKPENGRIEINDFLVDAHEVRHFLYSTIDETGQPTLHHIRLVLGEEPEEEDLGNYRFGRLAITGDPRLHYLVWNEDGSIWFLPRHYDGERSVLGEPRPFRQAWSRENVMGHSIFLLSERTGSPLQPGTIRGMLISKGPKYPGKFVEFALFPTVQSLKEIE